MQDRLATFHAQYTSLLDGRLVVIPYRTYKGRDGGWEQKLPRGWPSAQQTPPVAEWQGARDGFACVLGPSKLADVDLDSDLAVRLAPRFLRSTATFGRPGREGSHYLYTYDGDAKRRTFSDPTDGMQVEIRRSSGQTLLPGTLKFGPSHPPEGTLVSWDEGVDPASIVAWEEADERRVEALAVACLLAQGSSEGLRHDTALAMAGAMARAGWPEVEAARIVTAVAEVRGDANLEDRLACVRDTYAKHAAGQRVACWPVLRTSLGEVRATLLQAILGTSGDKAVVDLRRPFNEVVASVLQEMAVVPPDDRKVWRHEGALVRHDLQPWAVAGLREQVARHVAFIQGGAEVWPPDKVLANLLETDVSTLPELLGTTRVPILRPNGDVVMQRGYDPVTRYWLEPADVGGVGCTRADAEASVGELLRFVEGAAWEAEVDSTVWLAHVLTVVGRPLYDVVPGFLYTADQPGAGKTSLARVAGIVGSRTDFSFDLASEEIEIGRQLMRFAGEAAVTIDNLKRRLSSPKLETAITKGELEVRVLHLGARDYRMRPVVALTGNGATVSSDWMERLLPIRLKRQSRVMPSRSLAQEALARPDLTGHALTILRAFLLSGAAPVCTGSQRFGSWGKIVPACIAWLGRGDLVARAAGTMGGLDEGEGDEDILAALRDMSADRPDGVSCMEMLTAYETDAHEGPGIAMKRAIDAVLGDRCTTRMLSSHMRAMEARGVVESRRSQAGNKDRLVWRATK